MKMPQLGQMKAAQRWEWSGFTMTKMTYTNKDDSLDFDDFGT